MSTTPQQSEVTSAGLPLVDEAYLAERSHWVTRETKDSNEWGENQAEAIWTKLYARYAPIIDGRRMLDLGCSWGYMLKFLAERFKPDLLIGVDIKPWWEIAGHGWDYRALGDRLQLLVGDLREIAAIEPESLDLILCTSTLQYMKPEQLEENLLRAYELLRPGGEMLLRTRVFTSYLGADLHRDIQLPYVHLLFGQRDLARFMRERRGVEPPYLNALTASTYLAIFMCAGFEVMHCHRRMNRRAPEVMERVAKAFPWIAPEELFCSELEVRLARPIEPEEISRFGKTAFSKTIRG